MTTTNTDITDLAPPGNYEESTFGEHEVHEPVTALPADPVLIEEGWYAEMDGAEVHYSWATTAIEAAKQYAEDGDWGATGDGDPQVNVYCYRQGLVVDRETGKMTTITIDGDWLRVDLPGEDDETEDLDAVIAAGLAVTP